MEIDDDDADIMEVSVPLEEHDDLMIETVRLRRFMSISVHKQMMIHVLWPRQLPSKDNENTAHETALVALMTDTLEWFENTNDSLTSCSKLFRGVFNTHTSQEAQIIAMEINRLKHGDMFGWFCKEQNCGITVYIPPDSSSVQPTTAIISTFPVSIDNEDIYAVKHSEFQVIFTLFWNFCLTLWPSGVNKIIEKFCGFRGHLCFTKINKNSVQL